MSVSDPVPQDPVPQPFHDACLRWVRGVPTPYDTAVLTALTTSTPLSQPHDPVPVGFDPITRLPPPQSAQLFHDLKDRVRASHHSSTTAHVNLSINQSFSSTLPAHSVFPRGLASAPARNGLLDAAHLALGARDCVQWRAPFYAIASAGVQFVLTARKHGWNPLVDVEQAPSEILWTSDSALRDGQIMNTILTLRRSGTAQEKDILPAGVSNLAVPRAQRARAGFVKRCCINLRLAVDRYKRVAFLIALVGVVAVFVYSM